MEAPCPAGMVIKSMQGGVKSVQDDVQEGVKPTKMHVGKTWRAEVKGTMANLRHMKKWKTTTQYSNTCEHLLQLMGVYNTSARVGCTCTIYSKKKVAKMFESGEAFNQEALTHVTQKCECENEKTERSRDVFNEAMGFVGVVSFFPQFSKGE